MKSSLWWSFYVLPSDWPIIWSPRWFTCFDDMLCLGEYQPPEHYSFFLKDMERINHFVLCPTAWFSTHLTGRNSEGRRFVPQVGILSIRCVIILCQSIRFKSPKNETSCVHSESTQGLLTVHSIKPDLSIQTGCALFESFETSDF